MLTGDLVVLTTEEYDLLAVAASVAATREYFTERDLQKLKKLLGRSR